MGARAGAVPGQVEKRAYVSLYSAEQIINWRIGRVNGRKVPTLLVLRETVCRWNTDPALTTPAAAIATNVAFERKIWHGRSQ